MVEVEIAGEVEYDTDMEGVEHYRIPLSNGVVLQLYGNGICVDGYDGFISYQDLVEVIVKGGAVLIPDEGLPMEA